MTPTYVIIIIIIISIGKEDLDASQKQCGS